MGLTFGLTVFAWIFFRATNVTHALSYIAEIFSSSLFTIPFIIEESTGLHIFPKVLTGLILIFILIEWIGREQQYAIAYLGIKWKRR